eukprot:gnl/TRDRNA2_/TRDRNA2_189127_c0_seq1.p1 gnl/TRDRNA2_/TRDRNA2_189127_c0~~gnl/TRDRNA2_/TRDRNA2_189127_c0_seq1.p1  ORF type:complete len:156 (+),score=32.91 gnl/TRDRNA2_/TRDRNA2_189127_c0_seq1:41-508(+)
MASAASVTRFHRFKALQDVLGPAVPPGEDAPVLDAAKLVGLSALVPDAVVQQALHIVDAGDITCVQSEKGRRVFEVRGKQLTHLVLPHGAFCSCPYFGRRVLEAGELCCKHWLAVQLAMRTGTGVASTSTLGEDEFADWTRQRVCASPLLMPSER